MLLAASVHADDDCSLKAASSRGEHDTVKVLLKFNANINKIDPQFVKDYLQINANNLSYILDLDRVVDLSRLTGFDHISFVQVKNDILQYISAYVGKYVTTIVNEYI